MEKGITIVYANRDRSPDRIRISLESLAKQTSKDFKVVFVDYGSKPSIQGELTELFKNFSFVEFYPLKVRQLLWNKSKALNYGILKSHSEQVFIADVDLIFDPQTLVYLQKLVTDRHFNLFPLQYISEVESRKLYKDYDFFDLQPERSGDVNGMILAPRKAFLEVNGFDEFFHFYGAEDVDLFDRMENAGYTRNKNRDCNFFYHNWHISFSATENNKITRNPRVDNIMRINERHHLLNRKNGVVKPKRQTDMGKILEEGQAKLLDHPDLNYTIPNIQAMVEHFLNEELRSVTGVVRAKFEIDPYYESYKYRIKKFTGKHTQPYISLKEVNDRVLKKILFDYRDENYSFEIAEDLKSIEFRIEL